jgi:hypothetical protein
MAYKIDKQSVRKLRWATSRAMGSADVSNQSRAQEVASPAETCWGRLTSKVDDGWEWHEVYRKHDGEWEQKEGGREGTNTPGPSNLALEMLEGSAVEDEIYLLRRVSVLDDSGDNGEWKNAWMIIVSAVGARKVKCVDDYGHDNEYVSVKTLNASNVVEGEAFDVEVVRHTSTNDVFFVVQANNTQEYLQLFAPKGGSKYQVWQNMDGGSGPQSWDKDWIKGHA